MEKQSAHNEAAAVFDPLRPRLEAFLCTIVMRNPDKLRRVGDVTH